MAVPAHPRRAAAWIKVAASTGWEVLKDAGIDPAPERTSTTWAAFLRSQAEAILAADFFEAVTLTGTRDVRPGRHRTHQPACSDYGRDRASDRHVGDPSRAQPSPWTYGTPAAGTVPDTRPKRKYPTLFDAILADAGIKVVLSGVRVPRMNTIMERGSRPAASCLTEPGLEPSAPAARCASTSNIATGTGPI